MEELRLVFKYFFIDLKNLLSTSKGIFNFILGMFWIFFYIFIRFFRDITGYSIIDLKDNLNIFLFFIFLFFVVVNLLTIFSYLILWYKKKYNKKISPLSLSVYEFFSSVTSILFWKPLESIYNLINIPWSASFFLFLEQNFFLNPWLRDTPSDRGYVSYLLIFLFNFLPKLGLSIVFFIEVIFFCRVYYFLYFLPFLFLPIIFKIVLRLMETFATKTIIEFSSYFVSQKLYGKRKNIYGCFKLFEHYDVILHKKYSNFYDALTLQKYILCSQNILMQVYFTRKKLEETYSFTDVFVCLFYACGGIVRLWIILF